MNKINEKMIPSISIIIPVIREERVKDCIKAIEDSGYPESRYEIITEVDYDRVGCPNMLKHLVDRTNYDLVMFLGDDTEPEKDFLIEAVNTMKSLPDGWGLVGLNDGIHNGELLATHWLADKRLLDLLDDREFFNTGYVHTYCDVELTDIAREAGRYAWAENALLKHNHPIVDDSLMDEDYKRVYASGVRNQDHKLYLERRKGRGYFKLGIALPITDVKVYTSFFTSWTMMEKPDFTLLMPQNPGPIETIRNNLVVQALRENCTHLIMMDTDQNYPTDVIPKLLSHDKRVVAAPVHRRYPPFDVIALRGELGADVHVPDDECFTGELIEVDAIGAACVLYDTTVFLDIPYPWFEQYQIRDGRNVGEDIDFCHKLRNADIDINVDTDIKIGHISHVEITREFYLLYREVKGLKWGPPPENGDAINNEV